MPRSYYWSCNVEIPLQEVNRIQWETVVSAVSYPPVVEVAIMPENVSIDGYVIEIRFVGANNISKGIVRSKMKEVFTGVGYTDDLPDDAQRWTRHSSWDSDSEDDYLDPEPTVQVHARPKPKAKFRRVSMVDLYRSPTPQLQ